MLSFWFTRGGDCENQQDVFERAYRRYRARVNFLAIDVRDSTSEVQKLIRDHHWTHPVGLDRDGALSNLYRVGGCPTFVYAYPGRDLPGDLDRSARRPAVLRQGRRADRGVEEERAATVR